MQKELSEIPCLFRQRLDEYERENAHDKNFCKPKAERISHWSQPHIALDRVKRIMAGAPPQEWEANAMINAIGGKFRRMLPHEVFGEILRANSGEKGARKDNGIISDSGISKDRNYHYRSEPKTIHIQ